MTTPPKTNVEALTEADLDPPSARGGLEREVLGKSTVLLRNFGGIVAVLVVCLMGLWNSYTVFVSVTQHQIWPSETSMFIMVVGPVICSWSWMNVSKIVNTVLGGAADLTRLRSRAAQIIAPPPPKEQ